MNECDSHPKPALPGALLRLCCTALALTLAPLAQAQTAVEYGNVGATVSGKPAVAARQAKQAKAAQPAAAGQPTPAEAAGTKKKPVASRTATRVEVPLCSTEAAAPLPVNVTVGKTTLLKLPAPIVRRTLGDEEVVQAALLSPQVLYLLGVEPGATNMILQDKTGKCTLVDVVVGMDAGALQSQFDRFFPEEKALKVSAAADTLVLSGTVADATKVDRVLELARAYVRGGAAGAGGGGAGGGGGAAGGLQLPRIVNMLSLADPQQVLLEVKVAEVSKTLLDKLGAQLQIKRNSGNWNFNVISDFSSGGNGIVQFIKGVRDIVSIDGEKDDAFIKILAEPTVMAISGQEGSFLAGGKIFIPVAQSNTGGVLTISLEEKEFGIGLRFTPTVLDGGRINLKVAPEVSELSPQGVTLTAPGAGGASILPLITTRRAATTVQLYDGQSFVIGGLIKNNVTQNINAFPVLGEIPILGALFRSSNFQTDRTELLIIVTPHLAKPLEHVAKLPTDNYIEPTRAEFLLGGKMEGTPPQSAEPQKAPQPKPQGGFELK